MQAGRDAEAEVEARQAADNFGADEAEQQGALYTYTSRSNTSSTCRPMTRTHVVAVSTSSSSMPFLRCTLMCTCCTCSLTSWHGGACKYVVHSCCAGDTDFEGRDAVHDDFETEEALEDEEDVMVLGGEGFNPEQIAAAEARLNIQLVCMKQIPFTKAISRSVFAGDSCHR